MKRYIVNLLIIVMSLNAPLSFADIITCPTTDTNGIINNHDNWSVKMTFSPIRTSYEDTDNWERNLFFKEPQINIMDAIHQNYPNPTDDEFKTMDLTKNNGQYNLLSDLKQTIITCPSIVVTVSGLRKNPGIFYGEYPPIPISMLVTVTATKKLDNYFCIPLNTVPLSFDCRQQ